MIQPFRFPGQYEDFETGLYYNYFRDYDPVIGRYVEADPIGLAGEINPFGYTDIVGKPSVQTNLYLYTNADPINIIDPLGLQGIWSYGNDSPLGGFYSQVRAYEKIANDTLETAGQCSAEAAPFMAGLVAAELGAPLWLSLGINWVTDVAISVKLDKPATDPTGLFEIINPPNAWGQNQVLYAGNLPSNN